MFALIFFVKVKNKCPNSLLSNVIYSEERFEELICKNQKELLMQTIYVVAKH